MAPRLEQWCEIHISIVEKFENYDLASCIVHSRTSDAYSWLDENLAVDHLAASKADIRLDGSLATLQAIQSTNLHISNP
jgi:hypothetical protein